MQLLRFLRVYLYIFLDLLSRLIPSFRKIRYDLIIVRVDALGDYVVWHDALSAYKERFKGGKVLLVCADFLRELVEQEDFFTEVYYFNRIKILKSPWRYWKTLRHMKSLKADLVLYPCWERHLRGDILSSQISSKMKVSMVSRGVKRCYSSIYNRTYNRLLEYKETPSEIRAVEYFTREMVIREYEYGFYPYNLEKEKDFCIPSDYVVVSFSSSTDWKTWELDKFIEVINIIPESLSVVLTGAGQSDESKAAVIVNQAKGANRIINLVNKTSTLDLVLLISKSVLVIGNDSAAVHIAAATRVKSICVLFGAHYGRFLPYPQDLPFKDYLPIVVTHRMSCFGCRENCVFDDIHPYECMKRIQSQDVISKVQSCLSNYC